jgi:GAF domain-containing protein
MNSTVPTSSFDLPAETLDRWQRTANLMAELIDIPAALIMRLLETDIEVCVSSRGKENPYHPGDREHFLASGLYCETVINSNDKLLVPNALKDERWKNNPDVKLDMISYLGFPILLPDGQPFGTICVLDSKENTYSPVHEELLMNFRDIVQSHLELVYMNSSLGEQNMSLTEYIDELKLLRGIVPICCHCKKIKGTEGEWDEVETFVSRHSEAQFSHSYCPTCMQTHYGDILGEQT